MCAVCVQPLWNGTLCIHYMRAGTLWCRLLRYLRLWSTAVCLLPAVFCLSLLLSFLVSLRERERERVRFRCTTFLECFHFLLHPTPTPTVSRRFHLTVSLDSLTGRFHGRFTTVSLTVCLTVSKRLSRTAVVSRRFHDHSVRVFVSLLSSRHSRRRPRWRRPAGGTGEISRRTPGASAGSATPTSPCARTTAPSAAAAWSRYAMIG